jgi:hypothetical protein
MAITTDNTTINSSDVIARIEELEEETGIEYEVYRTRNDEVIASFDVLNEAESYISEEDYNPDRVKVRETDKGDEEDRDELRSLRDFDSDGRSTFGTFTWQDGITLINENGIGQEYARERAESENPRVDWDTWPFNLIDWDYAATELTEGNDYADLSGVSYYYL